MQTEIYMPVKIFHGKNCITENPNVFSSLGKSCLIITGGSSAEKCGALCDIENTLKIPPADFQEKKPKRL